MRKVLSNVDSIIKWIGYITLASAIFCFIGALYCAFSVEAEKHLGECLMYAVSSFLLSTMQFATYIVVRSAKVYLIEKGKFDL